MTRKHFLIFSSLFALLIAYCYFFLDTRLAIATQEVRKEYYVPLKIVSILISPPTLLCVWTTLFVWSLFIQKSKTAAKFYFPLVFALIMTNAIVRVLKVIIGRSRPDYYITDGIYQFKLFSFDRHFSSVPSGHAATVGVFIGFIACLYPKYAFWIISIGLILSLSRVLIGAHYISDALIGDFIGFYIAWLCFYKYKSDAYLCYAEKGEVS